MPLLRRKVRGRVIAVAAVVAWAALALWAATGWDAVMAWTFVAVWAVIVVYAVLDTRTWWRNTRGRRRAAAWAVVHDVLVVWGPVVVVLAAGGHGWMLAVWIPLAWIVLALALGILRGAWAAYRGARAAREQAQRAARFAERLAGPACIDPVSDGDDDLIIRG